MCLDNFSTSHGRQPTYDKGRMICVAWSHPQDKTKAEYIQRGQNGSSSSLLNVSSFEAKDCSGTIDDNDDTTSPDLVVATPDVSPHTSLTGMEAHHLSRMVHAALHPKAPAGLGPTLGSHNNKFGHYKRFDSCPNLSADSTSIVWLKKNH